MKTLFQGSTAIKYTMQAALFTTLLSGCAAGIDEQKHQQQLHTFINQIELPTKIAQGDEVNWWQQLNSSQLNQLVADALSMNHDLKTSQLQLQSTIARLGAQKAQFLPQGDLSVNASRNSLTDNISNQSNANIAVNWQLDLFGRISALVDAAAASTMSQAEQLRLLKIEVISGVVNRFVSYQGNRQKQDIINQQIIALEKSISVLTAQVEEGEANELDLNRTRAQLAQQRSILPEVEYLLYRDLSTLALLTGRVSSKLNLKTEQGFIDTPLTIILQAANNAIALRPDISEALYEFSQAHSLSIAASRALLPDISISAFSGVLATNSAKLSNTTQQWQVAPQIQWSLLSYPALLAQRDAQQLLSEAAYSDYQQVVLGAISESELALHLLAKEQQKKQHAQQRYFYANKAFLQAEAMYQEGQIPYLSLLDARQDVLMAQENVVNSATESLHAKVATYHAFNGRWSYALTR